MPFVYSLEAVASEERDNCVLRMKHIPEVRVFLGYVWYVASVMPCILDGTN
jgi:hypothetical protein